METNAAESTRVPRQGEWAMNSKTRVSYADSLEPSVGPRPAETVESGCGPQPFLDDGDVLGKLDVGSVETQAVAVLRENRGETTEIRASGESPWALMS